jgi:hypothetical protein
MKIPAVLLAVCVSLASSHFASATVTLSLGNPAVGILTNLADSTGNAASGLSWGVVVDTAGDGFDISTTFGPGAGLQLVTNKSGVALAGSDDVFFYDAAFGTATTPGTEGGTGSATNFSSMVLNGTLGVSTGDLFAIVWFDRGFGPGFTANSETRWGFYTNAGLVLPADGANQPYGSLFVGPDPVRPVPVPEPSAPLLGLGAALSLWFRRRSKTGR